MQPKEIAGTDKSVRIHPKNFHLRLSLIVILVFASLITFAVYQHAWITEDAFITLRYVSNTLMGYGAVFNVGDHVQGYSHPLWFGLLVIGSLIFSDPVLVAIGWGLIFTFATAFLIGHFVFRLTQNLPTALGLLLVYGMFCVLSKPWLSFQTSGLENSLSHFLILAILIECYLYGISRMGWLTFLLCLLCLNRPDFVFFVVPLGLLVLWNIRNWHQAGSVLVGSLPALAWLLFALIYYENVVPNTAYAKLGVYATAGLALQQGWQYLLDWLRYDMFAAGSTLLFMLLAVFIPRRSAPLIACISGIGLYFLWIIWVGGDFMRGRLFMPVFVAALFSGILWIDANLQSARLRNIVARWGIFLLLTFFAANQIFTPDPGATISEAGIVDERAYYPGYHLENYMQYGFIGNPYLSLGFAEDLKAFAEKCGPFVFHDRNPGTWGYLVGPKVTIIDTLGLTDAYIAKLPREYVISPTPRPGHADKAVPDAYYQERGAISLYPDWRAAVSALDCNFPHQKD